MSQDDQFDYLESERKKIWEKIVSLEELVQQKTSDYEISAKESADQAVIHLQTTETARESIASNLNEANEKLIKLRCSLPSF